MAMASSSHLFSHCFAYTISAPFARLTLNSIPSIATFTPHPSVSPSLIPLPWRKVSLPWHTHLLTPPSVLSLFKFASAPKLPEVIEAGDPVLHEVASPVPVDEIMSARIQKIVDDMVSVMRSVPGVGLAAPQIAIPLQIIVLEDTKEYISYAPKEDVTAQQRYPFDLLVIINPTLKKKGQSTTRFFEGCLSVNGFRGLVERNLEVEVSGFGRDGLPLQVEAFGWQARILQHECDHLAGLLYVDKLIPRTFRSVSNLRLPLPAGCPKPGVCLRHGGSIDLQVD